MSIVKKLQVRGLELIVFGTVKGLVSERAKLREIFDKYNPDLFLLGISPEEYEGLHRYLKEPFEIEPDDYGVIYAKKLEKFGEVGLPVPTYLEAFALSKKHNVRMIPVDMPDEEYSELFTRKVDFLKIMRFDMRKRKVWKKNFEAQTPEEFAIKWDREINRIREFMEIERERERYMAKKILNVLEKEKVNKSLFIVEIERMDGVIGHMENV